MLKHKVCKGVCPVCGSKKVESDHTDVTGQGFVIEWICDECGQIFDEVYEEQNWQLEYIHTIFDKKWKA